MDFNVVRKIGLALPGVEESTIHGAPADMNRRRRFFRPLFVSAVLLSTAATSMAQIRVITSGGFRGAYNELLPEFERTTGIRVITSSGPSQGNSPDAIGAQLRRGVAADVVIMSKEGLAELITEGRIVAGTNVDLAESPLGVAVRAGARRPDISTVEAFKQTLLRAASVTFPSSTTGIYMTTILFPRLGIAEAIARKSTTGQVAAVAAGEAEIAVQPVSELVHAPGVDFIGAIPAEIQYISVFSTAVVAGTKELEASRRLIAFLASERASQAVKNGGMEPVKRR
jgi:molybdate transport system substrate-binding protein